MTLKNEPIRNIHQYGAVQLACSVSDANDGRFIQATISKYPVYEVNEPIDIPCFQCILRKNDDDSYSVHPGYDSIGRFFKLEPPSGTYTETVYLVFNIAGHYEVTFKEYNASGYLQQSLSAYFEVDDLRTLTISPSYTSEGVEFGGWSRSITDSQYTLLQNTSNEIKICKFVEEEHEIWDMCGVSGTGIYRGKNEFIYNGRDVDDSINDKDNYGIIIAKYKDCILQDNEYSSNSFSDTILYKVAFKGTFLIKETLDSPYTPSFVSEDGRFYYDRINHELTDDSTKGAYVGKYDSESYILTIDTNISSTLGGLTIDCDPGDLLTGSIDNTWENLKLGEEGQILTVDKENKKPKWDYPSSNCVVFKEFQPGDLKPRFEISSGECVCIAEIYENDSINIRENGLGDWSVNEKGDLILAGISYIDYIMVENEDNPEELDYVTEDEETFILNSDPVNTYGSGLPDDVAINTYATMGSCCTEGDFHIEEHNEIESNITTITEDFIRNNRIFSYGKNTNIVWNWYLNVVSDELQPRSEVNLCYKLFNTETKEFIDDEHIAVERVINVTNQKDFYTYDFLPINNHDGILAYVSSSIEDEEKRYSITIQYDYGNIFTEEIIDINDLYEEPDYGIYEICHDMKIIKHDDFYSLYFVVIYKNEEDLIKSALYCINFSLRQKNQDALKYEIDICSYYRKDTGAPVFYAQPGSEISAGTVKKMRVEKINKNHDIIILGIEPVNGNAINWKIFTSSFENKTAPEIYYFNQLLKDDKNGNNILIDNIHEIEVANIREDLCVLFYSYGELNYYKTVLVTYDNRIDEELISADVNEKNYRQPIQVIVPSVNSYIPPTLSKDTILENGSTYNYVGIEPLGNDSFVIFYTIGDGFIRAAIGTVNEIYDKDENEKLSKKLAIYWQELNKAVSIVEDEDSIKHSLYSTCVNHSPNSSCTVMCNIISFDDSEESSLTMENKIGSFKFEPIYNSPIIGVASEKIDEDNWKVGLSGIVQINKNNNWEWKIGENLYYDDFGKIGNIPTKHLLGQCIGKNKIIMVK